MNPFLLKGDLSPKVSPGGLSPHASLNRHPLGDLPGFPLEPEYLGKTAFPAFSGARLEKITQGNWDPETWSAAQRQEIRQFGRLFGRIVICLVHPTAQIKDQRKEWGSGEWDFWSQMKNIALAGGIFEGAVGEILLEESQAFLRELGFSCPEMEILPHPALAGMTGAALGTGQTGWIAAVDAGQTRVKRGWVLVEKSEGRRIVKAVRRLEDVSAPKWEGAGQGSDFHRWLLGLLALPGGNSPVTALSLANYLPGGRPEPRGLYGLLAEVGGNYPKVLSRDFGRPVSVFHDGTAAAFHLEPGTSSVVIVAGTALGVGFA